MGICKESFGPHFWAVLHITCIGTKHVANIIKFIYAFSEIIPCNKCRQHFKQLIIDHPIPETASSDIFKWTVDMHNIVNKETGKEEIDYVKALEIWLGGCGELESKCLFNMVDDMTLTRMKDQLSTKQESS